MNLGEVREVSEGVYAYLQHDGSWYINNTGFLVSGTGVISIDSAATERRTRAYLDAIDTVSKQPVRTLVNTHHHGDHTHGNYLMGDATIVGHEIPNEWWVTCTGPTSSWTEPNAAPRWTSSTPSPTWWPITAVGR